MKTSNKKLLLGKIDHGIILKYLESNHAGLFSSLDIKELLAELKRATIVKDDTLPPEVIRLNSRVIIRDQKDNKEIELTLVTPKMVNIRERKISVMSPIGIALIGCRKGQQVTWNVPAGKKRFEILDVTYSTGVQMELESNRAD